MISPETPETLESGRADRPSAYRGKQRDLAGAKTAPGPALSLESDRPPQIRKRHPARATSGEHAGAGFGRPGWLLSVRARRAYPAQPGRKEPCRD